MFSLFFPFFPFQSRCVQQRKHCSVAFTTRKVCIFQMARITQVTERYTYIYVHHKLVLRNATISHVRLASEQVRRMQMKMKCIASVNIYIPSHADTNQTQWKKKMSAFDKLSRGSSILHSTRSCIFSLLLVCLELRQSLEWSGMTTTYIKQHVVLSIMTRSCDLR